MRIRIMIALLMCCCLLLIGNSLPAAGVGEILKPHIEELVQQLGADDWETRERATEELIALGSWVRPSLEVALKSQDAEVRTRARQIRIALRWKQAFLKRLDKLTTQLRQGTSLDQHLLNEVISFLSKGESCLVLVDLLREPAQPVLARQRIANALSNVSEGLLKPVIPELLSLIQEEQDPNIKYTLLNALAKAGADERILKTLKSYLNDSNHNMRITAIANLGRLGGEEVLPLLLKLLKDPNENIKATVISAIQHHRTDQIFTDLLAVLKDVSKSNLKRQIISVLSNFKNPRFIPELIRLLKTEKDRNIFQYCLNTARRFKDDPRLKKTIMGLLRTSDAKLRNHVLNALPHFGVRADPLMKQVIKDFLNHPDPAYQSFALGLIAKYGDKTFAPDLIKRLEAEDDFNKFRDLLGKLESVSGQKFFPRKMPAILKAEIMDKCRQWWQKEGTPK